MPHLDYKLLIFDWDGTLANSIGRIVEAMHMASTRSGFELCSDLAVKGIIGLGLPEAIRCLRTDCVALGVVLLVVSAFV